MKYLKALQIGVLVAIKVFIFFVGIIVPLNIMFDYFDGKDIQVYFTLEFVFKFSSQPLIWGVFAVLILLSCINQIVSVKRENT